MIIERLGMDAAVDEVDHPGKLTASLLAKIAAAHELGGLTENQ
jgi:hypothetical protein